MRLLQAATLWAWVQTEMQTHLNRATLLADEAARRALRLFERCFCVAVIVSCLASAFAASPSGFTRKLWQTQDGLPEQTVQAFAQTRDHYLWIGTTGGLLRFDGARFVTFDHENTPELKENSVFALLVSRDGSLWIGTEGGGLVRYRDGKFRSYGLQDGLSDSFVRALYEDRGGTVWVGTDNGLLRFAGGRLQRVDAVDQNPAIAVHAIAEDDLGRLWVGGSLLVRLDHDAMTAYQLEGGSSQNRVKSILETADHSIWVGTVSGLHRLKPGANAFERVQQIKGTVRVLRQTSDGTLWIGTIGTGIHTTNGHSFSTIAAPNELPSNTVLNVFEDDERNIWIGTQAGLLRLTRTPVRIVPLPQAADSDFGTIYADRDGTLWVVSTDVFQIRNGIATRYEIPALKHAPVRNVFRDRSGALWIGTDGDGIVRIDGQKTLWMTTRDGLVNNFIRAMLQSRDGSMWFATDEGVSHWTSRGFTNYQMRDGLSYFSTRALLEDRDGDIWIGTERGLSRLHAGIFMHDQVTDELNQQKVWAIHQDSDGGLWFGTRSDGLYRWRGNKLTHFTTREGLASNSIYQLIEDARGGLWMSGPNGISLVDRRELDAAANDPSRHIGLTLYGISNEVETTQIYGGRQPSGCLDSHGDAWFPSNRGPIHILRDNASPRSLPQVVVNEVLVDGRPVSADRAVTVQPGNTRLEIGYSPILLRSQDGVRFRYWLEGFDPDWTAASTRRIASYTNLPPGKYTFHVLAFEVNNPQATSQASLTVTQKPHFYRTLWFVGFCVLLTAALVLAIYRFRVWQIKMQFEAVLDERARLAREMHDTVIQGCASVSALLEALSSVSQPDNSLTRGLVDHARTQARTTIDEARRAVWNLRQQNAAETFFWPALERAAKQIAEETGTGVAIVCELSGKPFVLNQFATHELMMMAREAIYNAVLHGKPERIDVRVTFARKNLTLEVRDNGSGFNPDVLRAHDSRHYGLVGIRERVQQVGGRFQIVSAVGKGTSVQIQIPRKVSTPQSVMLSA